MRQARAGPLEGQDMVRGEIALRAHGVEGIPMVNVDNAWQYDVPYGDEYVKAGADIALAIGVEKMFSNDGELMFRLTTAQDVHDVDASVERFADMAKGVEIPEGSPRRAHAACSWIST